MRIHIAAIIRHQFVIHQAFKHRIVYCALHSPNYHCNGKSPECRTQWKYHKGRGLKTLAQEQRIANSHAACQARCRHSPNNCTNGPSNNNYGYQHRPNAIRSHKQVVHRQYQCQCIKKRETVYA